MTSSFSDYNRDENFIGIATTEVPNITNFDIHSLDSNNSCDNKREDVISDLPEKFISNVTLNDTYPENTLLHFNEYVVLGNPHNNNNLTDLSDVHPENAPILLTDNTHATTYKPFFCTLSNLNPHAKIFVNKVGHAVHKDQLLTNQFVCNKTETGDKFSLHLFQLSCFMNFCYILSVWVYACMCALMDYIPSDLIGNNLIPNINDISQIDVIDNIDETTDNYNSCEGETPDILLNNLRLKNIDRLITGHININSIRNKFEALKQIIKNNIDILIVSESKLDHSFPDKQFSMDGYTTIRQDREHNGHLGGGIIMFIREDIHCKELTFQPDQEIEGIFLEINLRKIKWLIMTGYNPKKENISYFLEYLSQGIDKYICNYDNMLLIGDFNSEICEKDMNEFCDL